MEVMNQFNKKVSFVEVEKHLEAKGINFKGEYAICTPKNENVIWWTGITAEMAEAFEQLIFVDKKITPVVSHQLVYLADGKLLNYSIAKLGNYQYKTKRWLPIEFKIGSIDTFF